VTSRYLRDMTHTVEALPVVVHRWRMIVQVIYAASKQMQFDPHTPAGRGLHEIKELFEEHKSEIYELLKTHCAPGDSIWKSPDEDMERSMQMRFIMNADDVGQIVLRVRFYTTDAMLDMGNKKPMEAQYTLFLTQGEICQVFHAMSA